MKKLLAIALALTLALAAFAIPAIAADGEFKAVLKGNQGSFKYEDFFDVFDLSEGANDVAYWHFVIGGPTIHDDVVSMRLGFNDGADVLEWNPSDGFSKNNGGNHGWVVITPMDWTIRLYGGNATDGDSYVISTNDKLQFNLSGYAKVPGDTGDPYGILSIEKTVDGGIFAEWFIDFIDPLGFERLDDYFAAVDEFLADITFYAYAVDGKDSQIEEPPVAVGKLGSDGAIAFTPNELAPGWYAIVEAFADNSKAAEIFEPAEPLYVYLGEEGVVYGRTNSFDYDALYSIVNGHGGRYIKTLNYPGLNNNGDIFYIGVTNTVTGIEYPSFCANAGSKNFAGDNHLGCSGYMVSATPDYNKVGYSDFVSAFNYIFDKYDGDLNDNRAITQTVVWALLGAIDVDSQLFDATNLTDAEKAAVRDVLANYDGYVGEGLIVDVVYLTCENHEHTFEFCQPQIVPVYSGDVVFNNKTVTVEPYGGIEVETDINALESFYDQYHKIVTWKPNKGESLTSARDIIEAGLVAFNIDEINKYGATSKANGIGAKAGDFVANWTKKNGKSENETLFKVDVAQAKTPEGVKVWIAERDGQDNNFSLGYYYTVYVKADGTVIVDVNDTNVISIGDFNVNAWNVYNKGIKDKEGMFGNGLAVEFGSNGSYSPFRLGNKTVQAMAGWKNEYKNVVDPFVANEASGFFYLHVHMKDVTANKLNANGETCCVFDKNSAIRYREAPTDFVFDFEVSIDGGGIISIYDLAWLDFEAGPHTVTLYINGTEYGTKTVEVAAKEVSRVTFDGDFITNGGNPAKGTIFCPKDCGEWK